MYIYVHVSVYILEKEEEEEDPGLHLQEVTSRAARIYMYVCVYRCI